MKVKSTKVPNLVVSEDTGMYYARVRVGGKLRWRSLETKTFSIAKLKLRDVEAELRGGGSKPSGNLEAGITFESAFHRYRASVQADATLDPAIKLFRLRSEATLRRTWPDLWKKGLRRIRPEDCQRWLNDFRNGGAAFRPNRAKIKQAGDSPTTVNAAIRFLRHVFAIGVQAGILYSNPGDTLKTLPPRKKLLQLPNRSQFADLIASIRATHTRWGQAPGDLVEGLAYTGARVGESRKMIWAHVDILETNRKLLGMLGRWHFPNRSASNEGGSFHAVFVDGHAESISGSNRRLQTAIPGGGCWWIERQVVLAASSRSGAGL